MKVTMINKRGGWTAIEYIVGAVVIAGMVAIILAKYQEKLLDFIDAIKF